VVVVPSALVYDIYRTGHLTVTASPEPWNSPPHSMDRLGGAGPPVRSNRIILKKRCWVLQEFAERREDEHLRLLAALIEASRFCDVRENRPELAEC